MGYRPGAVLDCPSCHDSHGGVNNFALQQNVTSADGLKTIRDVVVPKVPSGGYDLRFFCGTCHLWDSTSHDAVTGAITSTFPADCTTCHRHIKSDGVPSTGL
jgi:predicted CXXCH cytochrome family protein